MTVQVRFLDCNQESGIRTWAVFQQSNPRKPNQFGRSTLLPKTDGKCARLTHLLISLLSVFSFYCQHCTWHVLLVFFMYLFWEVISIHIHYLSIFILWHPELSGFFWQSCAHSTCLQQILGYRASDAESSDKCRSGWSIHLKDPIDNKGVGFQHSWLLLALNQKRKIVWCEGPTMNFVYSFRQYGQESIVVIRQIQTVALRMNQNEPKN